VATANNKHTFGQRVSKLSGRLLISARDLAISSFSARFFSAGLLALLNVVLQLLANFVLANMALWILLAVVLLLALVRLVFVRFLLSFWLGFLPLISFLGG